MINREPLTTKKSHFFASHDSGLLLGTETILLVDGGSDETIVANPGVVVVEASSAAAAATHRRPLLLQTVTDGSRHCSPGVEADSLKGTLGHCKVVGGFQPFPTGAITIGHDKVLLPWARLGTEGNKRGQVGILDIGPTRTRTFTALTTTGQGRLTHSPFPCCRVAPILALDSNVLCGHDTSRKCGRR